MHAHVTFHVLYLVLQIQKTKNMKSILEPCKAAQAILKTQNTVIEEPPRFASFVRIVQVDGGSLLFNALTRELLFLSTSELDELFVTQVNKNYLYEHWFLVNNSHKDIAFVDSSRNIAVAYTHAQTKKGINSAIVLTTTDCNARCFYCYEQGIEKCAMSEEQAHKTARYLIENIQENATLKLRWFGGEPLFNSQAIDIICADFEAAGVEFSSAMVSNGLLFDEKLIKNAVSNWHLNHVQITLDGTEDVYNARKAFVNAGCDSPFKKVLGNIELLLSAGVNVAIRLNVDADNFEDLCSLAKLLSKRFGINKHLHVYSHLIFQDLDNGQVDGAPDNSLAALYEKQLEFTKLLQELHLYKAHPVSEQMKINRCMADDDSSIVIMPDGRLHKCEHIVDNEFIGSIDNGITAQNEVAAWKERYKAEKICEDCAVYPECLRAKKCPDIQPSCNEFEKALKLNALDQSILKTYERHNVVITDGSEVFIKIDGLLVKIKLLKPKYFLGRAKPYLEPVYACTKLQPDISIVMTPEDVAAQRAMDEEYAQANNEGPFNHSDTYVEMTAAHTKLAGILPFHDAIVFHGSVIAVDGKAYLFTAPSGTGKSTHTRLWREMLGNRAYMVNDDKPTLRFHENEIVACGTPWDGKHSLSTPGSVPLAGICLLSQGAENEIHSISAKEIYSTLLQQCFRPKDKEAFMKTLTMLDRMAHEIPCYAMQCTPTQEAAKLAYETMTGKRVLD